MSAAPTTLPAEVSPAPGAAEADAIRADYAVAMQGMRAFVSMGLRLADVKTRLPHGKYMSWVASFLPDICHRHLHRAKMIAEGLIEMGGVKLDARVQFENLPPEILEMIDGATGYRALLATVQEFRSDHDETEAEAKCRRFFATDPALADEWEPRVLGGEISWCQAVRGIAGQVATKGGRRTAPDYGILLTRSLVTLKNGFSRWADISEDRRAEVVLEIRAQAAEWPADLRAALKTAL